MSISSTYLCCLSGVVPQEPVVARTSGLLFERRIIERALELNGGVCPKTNTPLTKEDLITIKSSIVPVNAATTNAAGGAASTTATNANEVVRPRPPSATSIPGILSTLQNEWDAIVLESFTLKQTLESIKQDLAHALYKEDAANRVIARLIKERDQARLALKETEKNVTHAVNHMKTQQQTPRNDDAMDTDEKQSPSNAASSDSAIPGSLPSAVIDSITNTATALSKTRKQTVKDAAAVVAQPSDIQKLTTTRDSKSTSWTLHSTTNPGILSVALSQTNSDLVLTGGNDGQALIFNTATGKIASHIKGHKSAVTSVAFHTNDNIVFTASSDHTANIWRNDGSGKYNVAHHLTGAKDALSSLSLHVSGNYLATGSKDGSFALYDVESGVEYRRTSSSTPLRHVEFHPDGALLSTGCADGTIKLWDLKNNKIAATLSAAPAAGASSNLPISAFAFSENAVTCASADESGVISLWDLRKLANYHTIVSQAVDGDKAGSTVSCLQYDASSTYLGATVGSRVIIYASGDPKKGTNEVVMQLYEHKDRCTAFRFGSQARSLVSVSIDRTVKIWA